MTNSISSSAHCLTVHLQYSTHYTVSEVCYVPLKITLLYCVICNYTPKPPPNRIIFYKPKNRQKICGLAKKFTVFDDKPPEKIQLEQISSKDKCIFKLYYLLTGHIATKVHLRAFTASRKTSCKISQASRLQEKMRLRGISVMPVQKPLMLLQKYIY